MNTQIHKFAADYSDHADTNRADWRALCEKSLRGADFEDALVKHTPDGIQRGPLFTHGPETPTLPKSGIPHLAGRPWHIGVQIDHPNIEHANGNILADLAGGASTLSLRIDATGENGVAVRTISDVARLLSGVHLDLVPISITPSANNFYAAALIAAHIQAHPKIADIHLSLGLGASDLNNEHALNDLVLWIKAHAPHWKIFTVNAANAHEAGGTPAQELSYMLAQGAATIRALLSIDIDIDDIGSHIDAQLSSDQDGHMGIVKFRAARLIWARMLESFGATNTQATLNGVSSRRMLSRMDPWSNLLRLSESVFGAVCGGTDSFTNLPFTEPLGLATDFTRRVSRNQQLLFMEESHLGHVLDPASGSYTHESLTQDLAKSAWKLFQDIEREGGMPQAQNWFREKIKTAHKSRTAKIKSGAALLVGVNQFAKSDVRPAEALSRPTLKARTGDIIDASTFTDAVNQAKEGHLLPFTEPQQVFTPVRDGEALEREAGL